MTTKTRRMLFSGRPRSQLVNMSWDEVSGVDHGANEADGWLVMKAAAYGSDDDGDEDEGPEELAEELFETDFSNCPPDIQAAASLLATWLAQEGYDGQQADHSEEPDEALEHDLEAVDFSMAPPNVREAASALGTYLASDDEGENGGPNTFPPVGIQLYGGTQTRDGIYGLRPGNGSQGFAGALSNQRQNRAGRRTQRMTKSQTPSFSELVRDIRKAAGDRFYGSDFGNQPFTTGNDNSYFSSQSPSQFPSRDSGRPNFNPQGGPAGSFYDNWTNPGPYLPTGNNGVSDGELANGLEAVARRSADAAEQATEAAFDQFLDAGWPGFAKRVADIVANYSSRVTSPTWEGGAGDAQMPNEIDIAKARAEIQEAVEDFKNQVYTGVEIVTKRSFSAAQRRRLAGQGRALPGGGFPIETKEDLMNARRALGRAKNPAAAKALIRRRARALGVKLPANRGK